MKLLFEKWMVAITVVFLATSCSSSKKVLYLQDVDPLVQQRLDTSYEVYIHPDDLLGITVNSRNQELVTPFNLPMVSYQIGSESSSQRMLGYKVDTEGNIEFPILGTIHAAGMSRKQLSSYIKQRLIDGDLVKDPIVTIQFLNNKVSVLGEVARPGSFDISEKRITLFDALSMAGDLTIYGRRDRVAVIREANGKRTILYHDLRSTDIFNSPCYYLQQNDIVYVEPNKAKTAQTHINQNNSVSVWLSALSILASVATLIVTVVKL